MELCSARARRKGATVLAVGMLVVAAACPSKDQPSANDTANVPTPGPKIISPGDSSLRADVESLKVWRHDLWVWADSMDRSFKHLYYCDTPAHTGDKKCAPTTTHIPPPPPPPK